ncbi:hypothetical protein BJX62DRAFT_231991 [Aspergillus germanicus]
MARLSTLWSARQTARNYRSHVMTDELYRTYGEFVRIRMPFWFIFPTSIVLGKLIVFTTQAPVNSLSIVDALPDIHSRGSVCTPYYDIWTPPRSIPPTRDREYHSQRRRVTATALDQHHPRNLRALLRPSCTDSQAKRRASKPVRWMNLSTLVGDRPWVERLVYWKTSPMHVIPDGFVKSPPLYSIGRCVPWLCIILRRLPSVVVNRPSDFANWSIAQFNEQKQMGQSRTDLFTYIIGEGVEKTTPFPVSDGDLAEDADGTLRFPRLDTSQLAGPAQIRPS